jgi:hypothetical protein
MIELYPQKKVVSKCFHGYTCVYKGTVHFDTGEIHHLFPQGVREGICDG